ncbi:MAG: hypothetical protein KGK10_13320 [Rhodospirillales bacterium]|nr:hypothetical protein [Rhodospirillales bacterium]
MKSSYALLAMVVAAAYGFPLWQQNTISSCHALAARTGGVAASSLEAPGYLAAFWQPVGALLRDIPGSQPLRGAATSTRCTIGYWRVVLEPGLYRLIASAQ